MEITDAAVQSFGRHETFHPRYGWLKKAYDCIKDDPGAFRAEDATVRFGVGKNMVNAIRFWSLAFKITRECKDGLEITNLGHGIFAEDGFDPYLERPETLWLLHWLLFVPPCRVPAWWIIMNMPGTVIGAMDVRNTVQETVSNTPGWNARSPGSIKRDIDVFLHTYTSKNDRLTPEEYIDCPFRNLKIARHDDGSLRFTFGPKSGLVPQVVAFACADFADKTGADRSVLVARLAVDAGSVGNIFKMSENDLAGRLKEACRGTKSMSVSSVNGEPHLVFAGGAKAAAREMLATLYAPAKAESHRISMEAAQ